MNQVSSQIQKYLTDHPGTSQSDLASSLEISKQLLSQYIKGRQKPKLDFYNKWEKEFGYSLNPKKTTNVDAAKVDLPVDGFKRTLKDYFDEIENNRKETKEYNAFLQRMMETVLVDISTGLKVILQKELGANSPVSETARSKKKPIVDPKALNPEVPVPPRDKPEGIQGEKQGSIRAEDKLNKRSEQNE